MPPKGKAARGTLAASVAPGRQSTRIAAREEAAQQAAEQAATAASPHQSMPPPSSRGVRGGVRGRPRGRGELYARRGTRRSSQARTLPVSIHSPQTSTVDYHPTQSEARGESEDLPFRQATRLANRD